MKTNARDMHEYKLYCNVICYENEFESKLKTRFTDTARPTIDHCIRSESAILTVRAASYNGQNVFVKIGGPFP